MVETTRVSAELRTLVVERARDRCTTAQPCRRRKSAPSTTSRRRASPNNTGVVAAVHDVIA